MTIVSYTRNGSEFSTEVEKLPAKSLAYLMQYGWAQSLQDCIAGAEKAKRAELIETDQFKALPEADQEQFLADEVQLHILAKLENRMKAILDGTIGAKVGQPRDPVTSLAREQIRAALAKAGKKIDLKTDDGKAQFDRLVASHVEKNGDKLRAEIVRRAESAVEIDLD